MAKKGKKYKLKEGVGGYIALTSPSFGCIIKKGEEVELNRSQFLRMKDFVEEVKEKPVVKSTRKKRVSEIEINGDI